MGHPRATKEEIKQIVKEYKRTVDAEAVAVKFYLSKKTVDIMRSKEMFSLLFLNNPYFRGIKDSKHTFNYNAFFYENPFFNLKKSHMEILEKQFELKGAGIPEIFHTPTVLENYTNVILIDKNWISGKSIK